MGGFKEEVDVFNARDFQKLRAVSGDKLLVGGDDALACLEAAFHELISRVQTAHDFNDDADLEVVDDFLKVLRKAVGDGAVGELTEVKNLFDIDFFSDAREKLLLVCEKDFGDT